MPSKFIAFPPRLASNLDYPVSGNTSDAPIYISRSSTKPKGPMDDPNNRAWTVSYHIDQIPSAPTQDAIDFAGNFAKDQSLLDRLHSVFNARPIVSRQYISEMTGMSANSLTRLLPVVAYFFNDGPWLKCWVRYGVDPRVDPECRWMQVIGTRLPIPIKEPSATQVSPSYVFTGEADALYISIYQICDIEYAPAKAILTASEIQPTCHKSDGWYPRKTLGSLRTAIKRRWLEILRQTNPEGYDLYIEAVKKASLTSARSKLKPTQVVKWGASEVRRSGRAQKVVVDPSVVEGSFERVSRRMQGDFGGAEEMDDDEQSEDAEDTEEDEYEFYDE